MAFTRAVPPRTTTQTGTSAPSEDVGVKCDGHGRRAKQFQAGPSSKNPGRWFYACPLSRDDPKRCKFFKWADELPGARGVGSSPAAGGSTSGGAGRTLGASPARGVALGMRSPSAATLTRAVNNQGAGPTTPTKPAQFTTPSKIAPTLDKFVSASKAQVPPPAPASGNTETIEVFSDDEESGGEIDWGVVDTDALERDAERLSATPVSAARTVSSAVAPPSTGGGVQERLAAAATTTPTTKRKRDNEGDEETPKRPNPFLATPSTSSTAMASPGLGGEAGPHPALGPTLTALEGLGEHLARQERLVRAAESMKRSMRKTIKNLQDEVHSLQARVAELEGRKDKNA